MDRELERKINALLNASYTVLSTRNAIISIDYYSAIMDGLQAAHDELRDEVISSIYEEASGLFI